MIVNPEMPESEQEIIMEEKNLRAKVVNMSRI
jgi:hypothetical protein